tara:strand:- start:282 stop:821 length:540 start_codon:yes stop_codon:yes gene_type:complete
LHLCHYLSQVAVKNGCGNGRTGVAGGLFDLDLGQIVLSRVNTRSGLGLARSRLDWSGLGPILDEIVERNFLFGRSFLGRWRRWDLRRRRWNDLRRRRLGRRSHHRGRRSRRLRRGSRLLGKGRSGRQLENVYFFRFLSATREKPEEDHPQGAKPMGKHGKPEEPTLPAVQSQHLFSSTP